MSDALQSHAVEVLCADHLDLTVSDLERSRAFCGKVLATLGFRPVAHESYVAWGNAHMNIGLREASAAGAAVGHDRARPGFHHLALKARCRADVDRFHAFLVREGIAVLDPPAEYPRYGPGYYAVFFADPDGMKLELVHFPWGYWRRVQSEGRDQRARG